MLCKLAFVGWLCCVLFSSAPSQYHQYTKPFNLWFYGHVQYDYSVTRCPYGHTLSQASQALGFEDIREPGRLLLAAVSCRWMSLAFVFWHLDVHLLGWGLESSTPWG